MTHQLQSAKTGYFSIYGANNIFMYFCYQSYKTQLIFINGSIGLRRKSWYNFIPVFWDFGAHYLGNVNSQVPEQNGHFSDQWNPLIFRQKWSPFFQSAKISQPRQKVELDKKKKEPMLLWGFSTTAWKEVAKLARGKWWWFFSDYLSAYSSGCIFFWHSHANITTYL